MTLLRLFFVNAVPRDSLPSQPDKLFNAKGEE
jgi:hypothetical protein